MQTVPERVLRRGPWRAHEVEVLLPGEMLRLDDVVACHRGNPDGLGCLHVSPGHRPSEAAHNASADRVGHFHSTIGNGDSPAGCLESGCLGAGEIR